MNLESALSHINQNNSDNLKPDAPASTELRSVDISIAGTPHRIMCPANEIKNLEQSVEYINQKIRDLRREIKHKNPNNEEFLLFVALEMYDQIQSLQQQLHNTKTIQNSAKALIEKLNKDARSML